MDLQEATIKILNEDLIHDDSVTVYCYGKPKKYNTRQEAINEYTEAMYACEGAEQERYAKVLGDLLETDKNIIYDIDEELEESKKLNEERYYYGEVEQIKNLLKNVTNDLQAVINFIRENTTIENPETNKYTAEQIDSLDQVSLYLENEYKNIQKTSDNLSKLFPNRIRVMTDEEKAEIDKMKASGELD